MSAFLAPTARVLFLAILMFLYHGIFGLLYFISPITTMARRYG